MPCSVHTAMQDADNFHSSGHLTVKNDVAPSTIFAVALPNVAAICSPKRMSGQHMKTLVQHRKVLIPLRGSPFPFGVTADFFQVGLGGLSQIEPGHQFELSLSSSSRRPLSE